MKVFGEMDLFPRSAHIFYNKFKTIMFRSKSNLPLSRHIVASHQLFIFSLQHSVNWITAMCDSNKLGQHDVWYVFMMHDVWMCLKRFVKSDTFTWYENAPIGWKNWWFNKRTVYYTYFYGWKFERSRIELKFQFVGPALLG